MYRGEKNRNSWKKTRQMALGLRILLDLRWFHDLCSAALQQRFILN